jgi:hypothetical protein
MSQIGGSTYTIMVSPWLLTSWEIGMGNGAFWWVHLFFLGADFWNQPQGLPLGVKAEIAKKYFQSAPSYY